MELVPKQFHDYYFPGIDFYLLTFLKRIFYAALLKTKELKYMNKKFFFLLKLFPKVL